MDEDENSSNILTIAPKIKDIDDFKKLTIIMKPRYKAIRSIVWRFFGMLAYKDGDSDPVIISNDSYCSLCFQEERLHCYKFSSSSTNLQRHLVSVHNITRSLIQDINAEYNGPSIKQENDFNFSLNSDADGRSDEFDVLGSKNISSTSRNKDTEESSSTISPQINLHTVSVNNLAVMCCKDLLPFDIIDGEGFQQFLINTEIVSSKLLLPTSSTIQEEVFLIMYPEISKKVYDIFNEAPSTISLSIESQQTTGSSNMKYSRFKFHFAKENFESVCISLPVVSSVESKNISDLDQIEQFCSEYNLNDKLFILVDEKNECDKITKNEFQSIKFFKHYCLLHSLNDLINIDGLGSNNDFQKLLFKIYESIDMEFVSFVDSKKLSKSYNLMKNIFKDQKDSKLETKNRGEIKEFTSPPWYILESLFEYSLRESLVSQIFKDINSSSFEKSSLKDEKDNLKSILLLLKKIIAAFEILNGNLYASCSLVMLFRAEIESILTSTNEEDGQLLKDIKSKMLNSLNTRFPITEIYVCAALLDPSQRSLPQIREYLLGRHLTSVEFLSNMVQKYTKICESSEIANDKSAEQTIKEELIDMNNSINSKNDSIENGGSILPWKKIKLEILAKHSNSSSCTSLEREIQHYMCLFLPDDANHDDPLMWWNQQRKTFPKLSNLAKIILNIPASCCSIANLVKNDNICEKINRLELPDEDLKKFLFLYENSFLINV